MAADPGRFARRLDLFHKTVMTLYATFVAWQTLKIITPGLQVKEDEVMALLRHHARRIIARPPDIPPPPEWVRDIYDDTRGPGAD